VSQGFSLDWLRLREVADRRARSRALAERFAAMLRERSQGETVRVVDLGAGTGANFRAIAPLIGATQEWRLIDHDPALLVQLPSEIAQWGRGQGYRVAHGSGLAVVSRGASEWRAHGVDFDLRGIEPPPLGDCHGVTCSALLDLVSADWLAALAKRLAAARLPFLAALTTDGRREWDPPHNVDAAVDDLFQRHHGGDKGFGPALGGEAVKAAASQFAALGHAVEHEASDWRLGAESPDLLAMLIDGTASAARETDPNAATAVAVWLAARQEQARTGMLRVTIGHADLLAT
jgi:hypothetical protein